MTARDKVFEHDGNTITCCEAKVLICCAKGMSVKETAALLCRSHKTIKRHRENIHARFGLQRYHTLTSFAIKLLPELEKWVL